MRKVIAYIFCCIAVAVCMPQRVYAQTTLDWSGHTWIVKSHEKPFGPGPNLWSDTQQCVWVDDKGRLHLKIERINGKWHCAEVYNAKSLGYGKYLFYINGRLNMLDSNVVLGMFIHLDDANEIDIEAARWGEDRKYTYLQYVVQPRLDKSNIQRTDYTSKAALTTHGFIWSEKGIQFRSYMGHRLKNKKSFKEWDYIGPHNPKPSTEKVHINLWLYKGEPPSNDFDSEIIINKFKFIPLKKPEKQKQIAKAPVVDDPPKDVDPPQAEAPAADNKLKDADTPNAPEAANAAEKPATDQEAKDADTPDAPETTANTSEDPAADNESKDAESSNTPEAADASGPDDDLPLEQDSESL